MASAFFRLSAGANFVLLGVVAVLLGREPRTASRPDASPARSGAATATGDSQSGRPAGLDPKPAGAGLTPAAVAEFEQRGISRDTLVNVLLEEINRRCDRRVRELRKKYAPRAVPEHEYLELSRQGDAERIRELKAAFGEDGYLAWDKQQTLRLLNVAGVTMSPDEEEQAYRLQKEFERENRELQMAMEDGVADRADAGALQAQTQEARDRELEKLLGKARFDELRGIADPAREVYRQFGELSPTPGQAEAVLRAESDYRAREAALTARLQESPGDAVDVAAELKALDEAREENLRGIFGVEAYETVKRRNDPAYQTLRQYAGAWKLADREVSSVYEALDAFFDQTERTRNAAELREAAGQRVNWREIDSAIEQARRQTAAGLQALLGDERLRRLEKNGLLSSR